jgi:hypothetical protein
VTGSPDLFTIDFDAAAEAQGFKDVPLTVLAASPISLVIPAGAAPGVYNGTINVSQSPSSCGGSSAFTVTVNNCNSTLNLKAFIQGYYQGTGMMKPVLLNQQVPDATASETDTITVELRESTAPYGLFQSSKVILSTSGEATVSVGNTALNQSYYIIVKHRNSIETWSADTVTINAITNYDFSTSDDKAYDNNQVEVENGVWAIFSGDVDQDGYVTNFDYVPLETGILNFDEGFNVTDIDGDGYVTNFDYPVMEQNILNFIEVKRP